jgi:hypothetical protein
MGAANGGRDFDVTVCGVNSTGRRGGGGKERTEDGQREGGRTDGRTEPVPVVGTDGGQGRRECSAELGRARARKAQRGCCDDWAGGGWAGAT